LFIGDKEVTVKIKLVKGLDGQMLVMALRTRRSERPVPSRTANSKKTVEEAVAVLIEEMRATRQRRLPGG